MISKELLGEVLNCEVPYDVKVHKIIIKNNSLEYFYNSKDYMGYFFETSEYINIYELAHKCKKWIKAKVSNANSGFDNGHRSFCSFESSLTSEDRFYADTEVEAIIKACEWILKETQK